ncbi:DUF115 domain-containing protein [bacterium]|nr:DUF115 domain-containing protein [bacterium]
MTKLFEKNKKLLARYYPQLFKRIIEEINRDDLFSLLSDYKELYQPNLKACAQQSIKEANIKRPKIILLYGSGLGVCLTELLKKIEGETRHILVIEKSLSRFCASLALINYEKIFKDKRIRFLVGANENLDFVDFFIPLVRSSESVYLKSMAVVLDPVLTTEDEEYYERVAQSFYLEVKRSSYYLNVPPEDTYYGFLNSIANLKESLTIPLFDSLVGKFKETPGILVSTGPSLVKNLKWLKKVQDRAIIACCDSALKILLKNGITPHIVGCLERVPETRLFFDDLPKLPHTYFLTCPIVAPDTFKVYKGPKMQMMRGLAQLNWFFPEAKNYFTGNSVSHMLYMALLCMGCPTVFLTGQDLAYDRYSSKSHAAAMPKLIENFNANMRNEAKERAIKEGSESSLMVEGNNGEPILTGYWLNRFREIFNDMLRSASSKTYNVIPVDYGAKLDFVERLNPDEALNYIPQHKKDISKTIKNYLVSPPWNKKLMKQRVRVSIKYLEHYFETAQEALHKIEVVRQYLVLKSDEDPCAVADFFEELSFLLKSICVDDDGFYNTFFACQIQHVSKPLALQAQAALNRVQEKGTESLEKLNAMYFWFSTVHFWSSRMLWKIKQVQL